MILIFGGTTEGRKAAAVCDEAAKPFYYSTKSTIQEVAIANGIRITGDMDEAGMKAFCLEKNIRLIVDAAHPFAEILHQNVAKISERLDIPVIRYERNYPERSNRFLWFDLYEEVIDYLEKNNIDNLLALTGVNTVPKLKNYWQKHNCWFRILNREDSQTIIRNEKFPPEKIIYYQQGEDELSLMERLNPKAILTKESGDSGGFDKKVEAATQLNIPVLVVKRPALSPTFIPVYGENGLRKKIESLLSDFFELRTGYTTGTCATAATKAALIALLTGEEQASVPIILPDGEWINLPVFSTSFEENKVSCSVLKDAGDDPDITNGQEIISTVQLNTTREGVRFLQGKGVGIVTLPGLGLQIGEPAINETPRKMMEYEIKQVLACHRGIGTCENRLGSIDSPFPESVGVDVTLSIPNGEEIAKKTFNPKLGIVGGISIIGTSGIVKPFSSEAFIAAIQREMQVAKALDFKHIVINSGAKSERFIKQQYPTLKDQAFIHYGNFIGETIRIASELGFEKLTMGMMIGKAVKLAEGSLDTHSKKALMNKDFLVEIARKTNCSEKTIGIIETITMARQLWDIIPESEYSFFFEIRKMCYEVCKPLFPNGVLEVLLINEKGKVLG